MTLISKRLKELRLKTGYTQKQIADSINVSSVSIQRFEYGTVRPSLDTLIALADFFDVSLDYLVGATDDKKQEIETIHVIPKRPFIIQDATGTPHKEYPNDFSVEIRGKIPPKALEELMEYVATLKDKYVFSDDSSPTDS